MHENLLREYLRYEPETGNFYWIKRTSDRGPDLTGRKTGTPNTAGYILIKFCGERLYAHRLAWLLTYGYMPKYIDHKNGKPWDNRLENLRECTHSQNHGNYKRRKNGVELHGRKYRVRIVKDGYRHELGSYASFEEAHAVADAGYNKLFGEFAPY